jgi:hypothetical protein
VAKGTFGLVQAGPGEGPRKVIEEKIIGKWKVTFTVEKDDEVFFYNCTCERGIQTLRPWPTAVRSHELAKEQVEALFPTHEILEAPHIWSSTHAEETA